MMNPIGKKAWQSVGLAVAAATWSGLVGCATDVGPGTSEPGSGSSALVAETAYVTSPSAGRRLWAAFLPSDGGGDLYLFDFDARETWKLEENVPDFASGIAALGARVDLDAIVDPRLRAAVRELGVREGNLRKLRRGEFVPRFEVDAPTAAEGVAGSRAGLTKIGVGRIGSGGSVERVDTCSIDSAFDVANTGTAVVTNLSERSLQTETDAGIAGRGEAVTAGQGTNYCTVWGACVYCDAYNPCVADCNSDFDICEDLCGQGYDAAIAAIDAAWQYCYDECDAYWQGFPCAGLGRASCRAACDVLDGVARVAAHTAYAGCLSGCALSNGACKEGCFLGSLAPSECCSANPPPSCGAN